MRRTSFVTFIICLSHRIKHIIRNISAHKNYRNTQGLHNSDVTQNVRKFQKYTFPHHIYIPNMWPFSSKRGFGRHKCRNCIVFMWKTFHKIWSGIFSNNHPYKFCVETDSCISHSSDLCNKRFFLLRTRTEG